MIDEDTGEAVADGAADEHGGNAAVNTSGETQDDAVIAQLLLQLGYRGIYEGGCTPLLSAAADVHNEVLQKQGTLSAVEDFGMELNTPDGAEG